MKEKLEETIFIKNAMQVLLDRVRVFAKKEKEEEEKRLPDLKQEGDQDSSDRDRQRDATLADDE
eukprot:8330278-Heterocapsa_arctica.AAC.1